MLNHNYADVGTYFRCLRIARELTRCGHRVTLLTKHETSRFRVRRREVDGVEIAATPKGVLGRLHLGEFGLLDIGYRLWRVLRGPADVVWAFGVAPDVAVPARAVRRLRRHTLLLVDRDDVVSGGLLETWRGSRIEWAIGRAERWDRELPHDADGVTVASRWLERATLDLGIPQERLLFLPNGADVAAFEPIPKADARARLGLPSDARIVLLTATGVGRDQTAVLGLLRPVIDRVPGALWVFVGHREPQRTAFVDAHDLTDHVHEAGFVETDEVPVWLAAADAILLPNADVVANLGRSPMRLGDAMAAGRPLVTAAVGEVADVVEREGIGVLAERDGSDLADRIGDLLLDSARADHLGRRARQAAEARYDWRLLTAQLESFVAGLRAARV